MYTMKGGDRMTGKEYHELLSLSQQLDDEAKACADMIPKESEPCRKEFWAGKKNGIEHSAERIRTKLKFMNS